LDISRVVDASASVNLVARIQELLVSHDTGTAASRQDVIEFLTQTLRLVPDVGSYVAAQDRAYVVLTNSLSETISRIEFEPFRLRVLGSAGSGKSQLALDFCERMTAKGRAPLLVCFNRPLADRIRPLLPTGATCGSYHHFINQVLTGRGLRPAFAHEAQSTQFWRRVQEQVIELHVPESEKYGALIVDEGQDFQGEWYEILTLFLKPGAPILWLEDPAQNIYRNPSLPLPGFVIYRDPRNFRTPRTIARFIEALLGHPIHACNPAAGLAVHVIAYDDPTEQPAIVAHRITELVRDGFDPEDIVVISCVGRDRSEFSHLDQLGSYRVKHFTGAYTASGEQVYTDGRIFCDTLYRFKGQQSPVVVLVDIEPPVDIEHGCLLLHCGMTRATAKLEIVMNRAHPMCANAVALAEESRVREGTRD
jgi:superfamily I DNA and RNA helicase